MRIQPASPTAGDDITIRAQVTNSGPTSAVYAAGLWVDGTIEAAESVDVGPGRTVPVEFSLRRPEGEYEVRVERLFGSVLVQAQPTPTPTPPPTPTPTPSPIPTETPTPSPAPSPTPASPTPMPAATFTPEPAAALEEITQPLEAVAGSQGKAAPVEDSEPSGGFCGASERLAPLASGVANLALLLAPAALIAVRRRVRR